MLSMKNHRVCDASHPMAKDHRLVRSTEPHWPFQLTNWFRVTGHIHGLIGEFSSPEQCVFLPMATPEGNHILSIRFNDVLTPAPGGRSSQTTDTLTPCFLLNLFTPGLIVVNKALRAIADRLMSMPFKVLSFPFPLLYQLSHV